jgi:hypothetical protein
MQADNKADYIASDATYTSDGGNEYKLPRSN